VYKSILRSVCEFLEKWVLFLNRNGKLNLTFNSVSSSQKTTIDPILNQVCTFATDLSDTHFNIIPPFTFLSSKRSLSTISRPNVCMCFSFPTRATCPVNLKVKSLYNATCSTKYLASNGAYLSSGYVLMIWSLYKRRDNFIFTLITCSPNRIWINVRK
jgi:hypothetical protein